MASLCLVAASAMAVAAGSAQAEVGSHWNVNSSSISSTLLPEVETALENNHGVLLTKILGSKVEVLCTATRLENAVLKSEGGALGKFKFSGCVILVGGVVQPACEPRNGLEKGVILTKLLKDLIVLEAGGVAGEAYDLIAPDEGTLLALITTTEECSIGSDIPIIGEFVAKDCNLEHKVEKVIHLFEEGPGTTLWAISKTEEHKATIDGSANAFLEGAHRGLKWSGTPA
jgi:hypothetical protein